MRVAYNEIDPFAVAWTRQLIAEGHIAAGEVLDASITDISAEQLLGLQQFHAFAGIGVWSHALQLAGWPDDVPVWTGSCPCQPFSVAGKRGGTDDARHLWPVWSRLIDQCRPAVVFGEQVASPDGRKWLDAVSADLEGMGYAFGAADLCAAGVGAPHIRQRLYFVGVADSAGLGRQRRRAGEARDGRDEARREPQRPRNARGLGLANSVQPEQSPGRRAGPRGTQGGGAFGQLAGPGAPGGLVDSGGARGGRDAGAVPRAEAKGEGAGGGSGRLADVAVAAGAAGWLGEPNQQGLEGHGGHGDGGGQPRRLNAEQARSIGATGAVGGHWSGADWLPCRDGKWRPVEPGTFPLAHGAPARVGRLRGYGNAIAAPLAATFVQAVKQSIGLEVAR